MTETTGGAPPPEPTFESIESELQAVMRKLEDPEVPLQERLQLHARAAALHQRLESILTAAREATGESGPEGDPPTAPAAENSAEPYEAVRDRLAAIVNTLEGDDLPLARIVALHAEARRLAARCEAILSAAQEEIARSTEASAAGPGAPETEPEDAPF